jgi:ribosome-associated protein
LSERATESSPNPEVALAVAAALDKKAHDLVVLDLRGLSSFTDSFIICHGTSSRQVQSIADAIEERLGKKRKHRGQIEGYNEGEWILMDYVDFVVHVFTEAKREFFNLERLWGDAPLVHLEGLEHPPPTRRRRRRPATPANV